MVYLPGLPGRSKVPGGDEALRRRRRAELSGPATGLSDVAGGGPPL